jgi:hypothetical protein
VRFFIPLILICISSPVYAGYTIFTYPDISTIPKIRVRGLNGFEMVNDPGSKVSLPSGYRGVVYTPSDFDRYSASPGKRTKLIDDNNGTATSMQIFAQLPQIRAWKGDLIRMEGAKRLEALAYPYTAADRTTWPQQQRQAEEWADNPDCTCIIIREIAAGRGITVAALVALINGNIVPLETHSGRILGEQQRLLDRVDNETDIDLFLSIQW